MIINADEIKSDYIEKNKHGKKGVTFKIKDDPRCTRIGKILRRTSLDELPQLWCVLKGKMSMVGPRPALMDEVQKYTKKQRMRLQVTPGITCIWQISGRSDIPFKEQCKMDIDYIENQSFWKDMIILYKTIPAIIGGKGAY